MENADNVIYAVALQITDFQALGRFARVSRRFAAVVNERREDIYEANSIVMPSGTTYVYCYLHSIRDQPAGTYMDGLKKVWYRRDKIHRDGDRPAEVWANGSQFWYQNGQRHRDGGKPAMMYASGAKLWYQRGRLHRNGDLPAVVWANGDTVYMR